MKTDDKHLHQIKSIILNVSEENGILVKEVILFGSRARGDFNPSSDYDFLIITNNNYERQEKMKIAKEIRKRLAQ